MGISGIVPIIYKRGVERRQNQPGGLKKKKEDGAGSMNATGGISANDLCRCESVSSRPSRHVVRLIRARGVRVGPRVISRRKNMHKCPLIICLVALQASASEAKSRLLGAHGKGQR